MTNSHLFLTNPRSGRRRSAEALERLIRQHFGGEPADLAIQPCESRDRLDSLLATTDANVIWAVGGDGTVHEIGKRLIGTDRILAILPVGSGNGLARHLGIPIHPVRALRAVTDARVESIDTVSVNGLPFLGTCGVGFDAIVAHRFAEAGTRGLATYVQVGFRAFLRYVGEDYRLEIDGKQFDASAFLIAIANSSQYGNEARIAPLASLQDGLIDVSILRRPPLLAAPALLARLFTGTLQRSLHVKLLRGREILLDRATEGPVHVDGEPLILPAKLRFAILPASLRVLVPSSTKRI